MTLPDGARFEAQVAPGIALWDVSHLLPRQRDERRDPATIDRLFVHHSGRLGRLGFEGALGSARHVVERRDPPFPGPAYTFWAQHGDPGEVDRDPEGRLVVYRCNPDNVRSWHTGRKANDFGVAIALQGNTTARPMSWAHEETLEAMIPWCAERYGLRMPYALGWHSIAGGMGGKPKVACPGQSAEAWLMGYVRGLVRPAPLDLRPPAP